MMSTFPTTLGGETHPRCFSTEYSDQPTPCESATMTCRQIMVMSGFQLLLDRQLIQSSL